MNEYRAVVNESIKALEGANRAPIEDPSEFTEHVKKLKMRLSEIDGTAELQRNQSQQSIGDGQDVMGSYDITKTSKFNDNLKANKPLIGNNAANHGIIGYDHGLMMMTNAKSVNT
jgi:hypothetical protein